jgi:hypothetical protein
VNDVLAAVRAHLRDHFAAARIIGEPDSASVTFLGLEPIEVLRFGADQHGIVHYVSVGASRHPMGDPNDIAADPVRGPRAEVVVSLRPAATPTGLARSVAVLAGAPAVEGLILTPDALVDLGQGLWAGAPFSAFLLSQSDIDDLPAEALRDPVVFLQATPITATEAAWVRLKGAEAMRSAWAQDGVDVLDPGRPASSAN